MSCRGLPCRLWPAALILALGAAPLQAEPGAWTRAKEIVTRGTVQVYVPLYTYHPPFAYSRALRESFNEFPLGAGLGVGRYNAAGNWEGLVAMEFADSHGRPQYAAAYTWVRTWRPWSPRLRLGAGVLAGLTARSDFRRYAPFPGALPMASIGFDAFDLQATYIPGLSGVGNVAFTWVKIGIR